MSNSDKIIGFIQKIKSHPQMFFIGDIDSKMICAYLVGLFNGILLFTDENEISKLFSKWINIKYNCPSNLAWPASLSLKFGLNNPELPMIILNDFELFVKDNRDYIDNMG